MYTGLRYYRFGSSVVFAIVAAALVALHGGCPLLWAAVVAVLLCLLQYVLWHFTYKKGFLSYALSFLPSASIVLAMSIPGAELWFIVSVLCGLGIIFIPERRLPPPRLSTSVWLGVLCYMLIVSLMIGITLS